MLANSDCWFQLGMSKSSKTQGAAQLDHIDIANSRAQEVEVEDVEV